MNHRHCTANSASITSAAYCGSPSLSRFRKAGTREFSLGTAPLPPEANDYSGWPTIAFFRKLWDFRKLDVEVLHVEGVVFDEFAPRLDIFAHQRGEDGVSFR